MNALCILIKKE